MLRALALALAIAATAQVRACAADRGAATDGAVAESSTGGVPGRGRLGRRRTQRQPLIVPLMIATDSVCSRGAVAAGW
eukprot:COSAG02_NODE_171_length_31397_cov_27.217554_22_plen_78_part_00